MSRSHSEGRCLEREMLLQNPSWLIQSYRWRISQFTLRFILADTFPVSISVFCPSSQVSWLYTIQNHRPDCLNGALQFAQWSITSIPQPLIQLQKKLSPRKVWGRKKMEGNWMDRLDSCCVYRTEQQSHKIGSRRTTEQHKVSQTGPFHTHVLAWLDPAGPSWKTFISIWLIHVFD